MRQWKVGSLTLGLTLIFIGIIFIIGNTVSIALLGKFIKFWPLIFIFLGIEILISTYFAEKNNERLKISGVSIFMFFIIFILCGALFLGTVVVDFTANGIKLRNFYNLKYEYQTTFTKNYSVNSKNANKLIISTKSGNVFVDKSENSNIEVTATGNIACNDKKLMETLPNSLVKIGEGSTIEITSDNNYNNFNENARIDLDLHIKIPEKIYTEVLNSYGTSSIHNIKGNVKVESKNGKIEVNNLSNGAQIINENGSILAKNISGNLILENSYGTSSIDNIKGNVKAESKNGNLELKNITGTLDSKNSYGKTLIEKIGSNVTVECKNGKLEIVTVTGSLNARNSSGAIDLRDINGKIDVYNNYGAIEFESSKILTKDITLTNKHGNINLSIPKEQTGHFMLMTNLGKISNDFNLSVDKSNNNKQSVDKTIGNSNLPIKISNDNGSISINSR